MIVIYHKNCADGFCCAWLLHKLYLATFHAASYGEDPPETANEDVIIADFSYKRDVLSKIAEQARSIIVLDHHKTAQAELMGLPFCKFDMSCSGARLVQRYFNLPDHWLIDYTEDRDLWRWQLPHSREINAALASYDFDFDLWSKLAKEPLIAEGQAIIRYQQRVVKSHIQHAAIVHLDGYDVPVVNATTLFSEIAGELSVGHPFAVAWFRRQDGKYQYSLRSSGEASIDVSEIAKRHGGGGHRNAAGFESTELIF